MGMTGHPAVALQYRYVFRAKDLSAKQGSPTILGAILHLHVDFKD